MEKQTGNYNDSANSQNSFNQSSGNGSGQNSQRGESFGQNGNSTESGLRGGSGSGNQETGLSDLAYNWISFVQCKADAVKSYQQYISDAEEANSSECADMFREACKADQKQLEQAKQHLSAVLQGTM
ncbi:hypothetical protein [Limnobacter parvus]|uniref:Uncharacterized protein n=1 Tax=Limnobacter parvus TaxID=2939690 RepID=A0ABT1XEV1_9BURK|nr:hypothetical protein [Limnobacter parvus]MCR2745807.1 hypothetical protein [Limnobacter parvus]